LLAAAAAVYLGTAWLAAPGFFDGISPPEPYRWVSPPPELRSGNKQPLSGRGVVNVGRNGVVDPGAAFTGDGQAQLSFVPGVFATPSGASAVTIDLQPVSTYPAPTGFKLSTNVYLIKASSSLTKEASIQLRYPDGRPAPTEVYTAAEAGGAWRSLGSTGAAPPFVVSARTTSLGYFAAGYPANVTPPPNSPRVGGGQALPILVAVAIVFVVLAGLPLAVLRRRGSGSGSPPP
jgi:hypothetical protein